MGWNKESMIIVAREPASFTNAARSLRVRSQRAGVGGCSGCRRFRHRAARGAQGTPGFTLSEGPSIGPESKPEGWTILSFTNSPGELLYRGGAPAAGAREAEKTR
jgi:hypothetical protein